MTTVTALGISFDLDPLPDLIGAAAETSAETFSAAWSAPLAETTARTYRAAWRRAGGHPTNPVQRSVALWALRCQAREKLEAIATDASTPRAQQDARTLIDIAQRYDDLRAAGQGAVADPKASARTPRNPNRKGPAHHRQRLKRLPDQWLETLFEGVSRPDHKRALAVMILTGCRPCALERGIRVSLGTEGLVIERPGEKGARGQTLRAVFDPETGPFADALAESLGYRLGTTCTVVLPVRTVEDFVARLARRTLAAHVTPMVIRAQVAADLKVANTNRSRIVTLLGQLSERSLAAYGTAHQGGARRRQLRYVEWRQETLPGPAAAHEPAAVSAPSDTADAIDSADPQTPTEGECTIRLRLLKVAAKVTEYATRVVVQLPSAFPDQAIARLLGAKIPQLTAPP